MIIAKPDFSLHQQIVSLHRGVVAGIAIARDVHGDQPGKSLSQSLGAEARASRRPRSEVLNEYIRPLEDAVQ